MTLVDHRVEAVLKDGVADVTVEQTFRSTAGRPLEGIYLFPLPQGAVVRRFAMTMGGTMVQGEVVEAKAAREVYEGIVASRRDPGLLQYVEDGLYRARVFPIEPGRDLTIRLSFEQVLPSEEGTCEWRYPLATERFSGGAAPHVRVSVALETTARLGAVYSPTAGLVVTRDGDTKAHALLEAAAGRPQRDLVLYVGSGGEGAGLTVASGKEVAEDGTFLAIIAPRPPVDPKERLPKDVVFVLDTSGSMQGEKIRQARAALAFGVRSLGATDRFRVLSFSSEVRSFRSPLLAATKENVEAAVAWIDALEAAGGTNIEGALREAFAGLDEARLPLVVFLTDGAPTVGTTDADALVDLTSKANAAHARLFPFGVGYDLDVRLLDLLAERNRGVRDYVAPQEDIEIVTSRFFRKMNTPVLADVELDLGPGVHDVYPSKVGDLFAGQQVVVTGRYATPGPRTIRLKGRVGDRQVEETHEVVLKGEPGPAFLARLWARRKVAFLLDQIRLHGPSREVVDEVTQLATRQGILTPYTSGLVVEDGAPRPGIEGGHGVGGRVLGVGGRVARRTPEVAQEPRIRDAALSDHDETDDDLPSEESLGEGGLSGAPFEGPANNALVGPGGSAGSAFQSRGGHRNLRAGGAGSQADDAVEDALRWLVAHASPDGRFACADFAAWCDRRPVGAPGVDGAGDPRRDVGTTALATLAFLGAGYTSRSEGPFGAAIGAAIRWLRNTQDAEGCFGGRGAPRSLEDHAWATLALVEAYGMTGSALLRTSAQRGLDYLAIPLLPGASAAGAAAAGGPDAGALLPAALAFDGARRVLEADARAGRPGGLIPNPVAVDALRAWARRPGTTDGPDEETAVRVLVRCLADRSARNDPDVRAAAERLASALAPGTAPIDARLLHAAAVALFHAGGATWRGSFGALKTSTTDTQRHDGDVCGARGSWDPRDTAPSSLGRLGTTALLAATIETMGARYEADAVSADPTPGSAAVRESLALDGRRRASTDSGEGAALLGSVRVVGPRTFRLDAKGRWLDAAWDGKSAVETVEAWSAAYLALTRSAPDVARALALGDRLVLVVGTRVVEVVPAAEKATNPRPR